MNRLVMTIALAVAVSGAEHALPLSGNDAAEGYSVVRGGRLYDNWYRELNVAPPREPHPLATAVTATAGRQAVSDSWRCSSCHGWDYRGGGDIPGIERYRGADRAAIVKLLISATHGYGEVLREDELLELAQFISRGQVDMSALIDRGTGRARDDKAGYEDDFATICAGCHGSDGKRVREAPPLGEVARERPYEALHVILNGHAGGNMPALRIRGIDAVTGMLAYLQGLPSQNRAASITRGGRLYDNWQLELQALPPPVPHPAYPPTAAYAEDPPRTWRCKECHGWDYRGREGEYAGGTHVTGIKGIRAYAGAEMGAIVAVLEDRTHRYGAVLKHRDLHDLARFVSQGQIDMESVIDRRTRRARGEAERAGGYYRTICASCHGPDGRGLRDKVPLGRVANESPWEALHKIVNGHPDEPMPALRILGEGLAADILAFLQTLPRER